MTGRLGQPLSVQVHCLLLKRAAVTVALALVAPSAIAATWFVETGLVGEVTATNNSNFDTSNTRESDVIVSLSPTIVLRGEGRRLKVSGAAALSAVTYVEGTQSSSFDPVGTFSATLEAVEKWLFIDASLSATRALENPLGPRQDGPSSFNRQTDLTARLSAYIDRTFPNDLRLLVRSDNSWTDVRRGEEATPTEYAARGFFRFSRTPRPFGWALEAERRRDDRAELASDSAVWYSLARLRMGYAFNGQLELGLRGGYEKSDLFIDDSAQSFYGAEIAWRPSERTRLEGFWEDRSFGDAWNLNFSHRSPFVAWDWRSSRDLTTYDDAYVTVPAGGDLAGLLDASLRTRIVDPIERAKAVEDFLLKRGLPRSFQGPINLFSGQVEVRTSRAGTVTLIGIRSTLALSGFYQRDELPSGDDFGVVPGAGSIFRQYGASLAYSLRTSSVSSALVSVALTRDEGNATSSLVAVPTGQSRQQTYRVQFDRQIAPRTTGFVGARYQIFDSDVIVDSSETAFFAGLGHRF
jgi:uncharacterized protein (PEP-CTERM system associated)